jgi:hypothetical protein
VPVGYIVKRLQDAGIRAAGLEISKHCMVTRVADAIVEWDICQTPWPFPDQSFDVCFSIAVLEHIPEQFLPAVIGEIKRICRRGLHGIDFGEKDDGFDKTHCTLRNQSWWKERMPEQIVVDKEDLETGSRLPLALPEPDGQLKLNVGCYTTMFHYGWINMDVIDLNDFATRNFYKFVQEI